MLGSRWLVMVLGAGLMMSAHAQNAVLDKAGEVGIAQCQELLKIVSGHLLQGREHQARSQWHEGDSDSRIFTSTVVASAQSGPILNTLFVTPIDSSCDGGYVRVIYLDQSCALARQSVFAEWQTAGDIGGLNALRSAAGVDLVLLPAGEGCIAQFSETLFGKRAPATAAEPTAESATAD